MALALGLLTPGPVGGQDFDRFPGFKVAAQADVIHLTGNVLARFEDDDCAFNAEVLLEVAAGALVRNGVAVTVLPSSAVEEGVGFDVSALALPVLDTDSCAVATRLQLTNGDGGTVFLAAEHFSLLTWTATGLLSRVRAAVNRDVSAIAEALRRERDAARGAR